MLFPIACKMDALSTRLDIVAMLENPKFMLYRQTRTNRTNSDGE